MKHVILFLLVTLHLVCPFEHDGITITINLELTEANTTIKYQGKDIKLLTDLDIKAFNLTKDNLENAVEVYSGEKATGIFIKSPTPWNDLYKTYNWSQVKREFKIKDIKLINVTKKEINVVEKEFTNNDTAVKNIKADVVSTSDSLYSTHNWSGSEVAASVKYELTTELTRAYNPPLHYGYTTTVGEDAFGSGIHDITYGKVKANFSLEPEQTAKLYFTALEVTTRVMVEYETRLTGHVAVNYANKHEGHHFWAYDINDVLYASNMTAKLDTSEYVEVLYLREADYKTKVVDAKSGMDIKFKYCFSNRVRI